MHIESERSYGQNIIKATLVHDNRRTIIIEVYIPPSEEDMSTTTQVDEALKNVDHKNIIILGDLNINFRNPTKDRDIEIAETIESYKVSDILRMFNPRKKR